MRTHGCIFIRREWRRCTWIGCHRLLESYERPPCREHREQRDLRDRALADAQLSLFPMPHVNDVRCDRPVLVAGQLSFAWPFVAPSRAHTQFYATRARNADAARDYWREHQLDELRAEVMADGRYRAA